MTRAACHMAAIVASALCLAGAASAARMAPEPLLRQFAHGHGVFEALAR